MLMSFIAMQVFAGGQVHTFSIPAMQQFWLSDLVNAQTAGMSSALPQVRMLMFIGLLLGFVVKAPMFPFHTWLPDAHSEAPTEMSVVLAAVMLKTGTYAMLRTLYPSFPDVAYLLGPVIAACGVIAIVYGAAVTLVQVDLKRMVAYSSISHMGFIILGIAALNSDATIGTIFHMVGHGIIICAMFFLVGLIERRYGTRNLHELAGLMENSRGYGLALAVTSFAGMGFPGLVGFWGEMLVLKGAFFNNPNWQSVSVGGMDGARFLQIMAILSIIGILTSAVYMINMLQRVLPGKAPTAAAGCKHHHAGTVPAGYFPLEHTVGRLPAAALPDILISFRPPLR
jgi:NADH-quinone oxidoreductase subunit M